MPEKSKESRAKTAKAKGTPMVLKASDIGDVGGMSSHAAKKSRGIVGKARTNERSVSSRRAPGEGRTARSEKLVVPEGGASSTSRKRTLPAEAAATYRGKTGRSKTVPTEATAAYRREERPKRPNNEAAERKEARSKRGSPVQGRKKAPSQMGITRRGGPRKRSNLHGG
jgi:hypothetical protein